jgi:membrane-associated protease RseP (regulator of RpoE activity)
LGLLGSSFYVKNPLLPLDKAVAMLNMDMIGRMREDKVYLGGAGTGSNFKTMLETVIPKSGLKVDFSDVTGYGSSDHASFTTKQVPVLFFFSGLHADYHRPSDTWDKIDTVEAAKLLDFVGEVAETLIDTKERPQYVKVVPPGPPGGGGGSGYGAYFGSIPDFTEIPKGVRFSDVREGSPAAKAGLKGGDILIEFDGKAIQNLYDFTYVLRAKKPGDEVKVKVLRDGNPLEVLVTLASRK